MSEIGEPEPPVGVEGTPTPWPGGGYMYRPGEVLAPPETVALVQEHVERLHGTQAEVETLSQSDLVRVRVDVEVPELIRAMRTVDHDVQPPAVSPNHVMHEFSHIRFFSRLPPVPAQPLAPLTPDERGVGVTVAVIDSGAWDHDWYRGSVQIAANNGEEPDENGNALLDLCRGHGTFVSGLVLQHAPGATVVARRFPGHVMGPAAGRVVVDDVELAAMLDDLGDDVDVVNMSLGGWTESDIAPPATAAALARLHARNRTCVVVAAAGNEPTTRPTWPAAFKGVIAVGALDPFGEPWEFSATGWWVDAWADGVDVQSTFFVWPGGMERDDGSSDAFAGWATWTGTSFAAPRISGTIAAMADGHGGARRAARKLLNAADPLAGQFGVVPTLS